MNSKFFYDHCLCKAQWLPDRSGYPFFSWLLRCGKKDKSEEPELKMSEVTQADSPKKNRSQIESGL